MQYSCLRCPTLWLTWDVAHALQYVRWRYGPSTGISLSLPQPSYVRPLLAPSPMVLFFANVDDVGADVVRRRDGIPPGQCSQVCSNGCRMSTGMVCLFSEWHWERHRRRWTVLSIGSSPVRSRWLPMHELASQEATKHNYLTPYQCKGFDRARSCAGLKKDCTISHAVVIASLALIRHETVQGQRAPCTG